MGTRKTTNITEDDVWKAARSKRILLKKESPKPQKNIFATDRKARLIHAIRMILIINYGKINLDEICGGDKEKESELIKRLHRRLFICLLPVPGRVINIKTARVDKEAEDKISSIMREADAALDTYRRCKASNNDYINTEVCRIIQKRDEEIFWIRQYQNYNRSKKQ